MINEKLASHLSARLWISKVKIEEVLGDFNEVPEPIVEMPVKMPIESEPKPQRDYTGIRFKFKRTDGSIGDKIFTLRKTNKKDYYTAAEKGKLGNCWRSVIVEEFFKFGTWIEVKEETPLKGNGYLVRGWQYNENSEMIITSVERLSDNEVFKIGDKLEIPTVHEIYNKQTIEKLLLCDSGYIRVCCAGVSVQLSEVEHEKQSPLVQPKDPLNLFDMNKRIEALEAAILPTKKNLDIETPPTNESSKLATTQTNN